MQFASRRGVAAASAIKRFKWIGSLAALALLASSANAAGICLSVGGPLYGGAILATDSFMAGCAVGLSSNVGSGGGVITTSPSPLPSPITQLTAASLGYSDPTGTANTATASLNTATLGDYDSGSATGGSNGPDAALFDTVHFHIVGGAPSATVGINLHLNGTESGTGLFNNRFIFNFQGGVDFQMANLGGYTNNYNVNSLSGWISPSLTNASQGGFDFTGSISVTDGQSIPLLMSLDLFCESGEICDFSHTAAVNFALPGNVTFTSDSGALLTGASTGTPEPASFLLLGAGCVVLGLVRRKRGIYPTVR